MKSTKVNIHISSSFRGIAPLKSHPTLCGEPIGATHGWLTLNMYMNPYMFSGKATYEVHLTKQGWRTEDENAFSRYMGFYSRDLTSDSFNVCKNCTNSEEFGMYALFTF